MARKQTTKMPESKLAVIVFAIVCIIAILGVLLALGVVKTGQYTWQDKPTAPACPEGWIKAWMHSENHTEMLKLDMYCSPAATRGMVCCTQKA